MTVCSDGAASARHVHARQHHDERLVALVGLVVGDRDDDRPRVASPSVHVERAGGRRVVAGVGGGRGDGVVDAGGEVAPVDAADLDAHGAPGLGDRRGGHGEHGPRRGSPRSTPCRVRHRLGGRRPRWSADELLGPAVSSAGLAGPGKKASARNPGTLTSGPRCGSAPTTSKPVLVNVAPAASSTRAWSRSNVAPARSAASPAVLSATMELPTMTPPRVARQAAADGGGVPGDGDVVEDRGHRAGQGGDAARRRSPWRRSRDGHLLDRDRAVGDGDREAGSIRRRVLPDSVVRDSVTAPAEVSTTTPPPGCRPRCCRRSPCRAG